MIITFMSKIKAYFYLYGIRFFSLIYVLYAIKKSYLTISTYSISKNYRETHEPCNSELVYGELAVYSFLYLLNLILGRKNSKIYDLGCGDGKLVLAAVLFFKNLNAIGIESVAPLQNIASDMAQKNFNEIKKNNASLTIFQDSFLTKDFSDGDIIYINSAALRKTTWDVLCERFKSLAKNSYLISVENKINSPFFSLVYVGIHSASWGQARVYIYEKI